MWLTTWTLSFEPAELNAKDIDQLRSCGPHSLDSDIGSNNLFTINTKVLDRKSNYWIEEPSFMEVLCQKKIWSAVRFETVNKVLHERVRVGTGVTSTT